MTRPTSGRRVSSASGVAVDALPQGDGVALWRKIEAELAGELQRLPAESERRLPTERELALRFGVNRHTVRQAVRSLAERGLVRIEQGRGMFAADMLVDYPLGSRPRFSASLVAQERTPGHTILGVDDVPASLACAAALGLPAGTRVAERRALGLADGVPLTVGTSCFPLDRFPDAVDSLRRQGSAIDFLAEHGITDYRRRSTRILARQATPEEARLLRQQPTLPVLVTEAVDVDADGAPISYAVTAWASGRVQLTVDSG